MPRMIAALFDDRATAERALQTMIQAGIARDRIAITGGTQGGGSEMAPFRDEPGDQAPALSLPLPDEDLRLFGQGLRRGCVLISARVDNDDFEEAIRLVEMFDPVDLDRRSEDWRDRASGAVHAGVDVGGPLGAGLAAGSSGATSNVESVPGMGAMADDASTLGTADLRTTETTLSDEGRSAMPTGGRNADERAGAPGVMELARSGGGAADGGSSDARADLHRRDPNRVGRVRAYVR